MVVQHLPLGGILEWNVVSAPSMMTSVSSRDMCTATPVPRISGTATNSASGDALVTAVTVPWGSSSTSSIGGSAKASLPHLNLYPKGS